VVLAEEPAVLVALAALGEEGDVVLRELLCGFAASGVQPVQKDPAHRGHAAEEVIHQLRGRRLFLPAGLTGDIVQEPVEVFGEEEQKVLLLQKFQERQMLLPVHIVSQACVVERVRRFLLHRAEQAFKPVLAAG
jgi:hypothetical protein